MKTGIKTATLLVAVLLSIASSVAFAQSGRQKPSETPSPTPTPSRKTADVYTPTDANQVRPGEGLRQDAQDIIKIESGLVPIPVSVKDVRGNPVSGLKVDDFVLEIDGVLAAVGGVSVAQSPVRLVLMFDNSSSVAVAREFEKRAAIRFLRNVIRPEQDLAALYSVSTVSKLEHPLTREVPLLVDTIEKFPQPVGLTALLDGLVGAGGYLRNQTGRRVVVVVSDGEDTGSETSFDETVRELQRANVQVFIVKTTDFENFKRTQSREGSANLKQLAAEKRMQEIARQTGGAVYAPLDDEELDAAFAKITEEISDQYLVSFFPEDDKDKSVKFRSIKLTVKGRSDLTVRTRVGYYGPR